MKLVILDRDGVINQESRAYIKSAAEWLPLPGSLEAIAKLTQANYTVVITTNQSGVGRGYITLDILTQIHAKMLDAVNNLGGKINKIYFCPHKPNDGCDCRKPKPGMFKQIEQDFNINLRELKPPYIGDSLRDLELGLSFDCKFFLVTGPGGDGAETLHQITPIQKPQITLVHNLAEAVENILLCNN